MLCWTSQDTTHAVEASYHLPTLTLDRQCDKPGTEWQYKYGDGLVRPTRILYNDITMTFRCDRSVHVVIKPV